MIYKTKKQIKEKVEELLDHYEPYRPILDSEIALEVRKVLVEILNYMENPQDANHAIPETEDKK